MSANKQNLRAPLMLWAAVTTFFAFQFILRQSAGILREEIMLKYSADIIQFGTLAGGYYLGYAGMQIPLGVMLDRFSLRVVVFLSIIIASIGTLSFVYAESWQVVLMGRFMIGAGSAAAFLSVVKVIKSFFPVKYHAFMIGFSFTFGLLGAVFGSAPMKMIFNHWGYEGTFISIGVFGIALASTILAITSPRIMKLEYSTDSNLSFQEIIKIIMNPTIVFIGVCGGLMVGSLEGFADVWAIPFFEHVYGYSAEESVFAPSIIYLGMCVGGPMLAYIADIMKSQTTVIFFTGVLTCLIFATLLLTQTPFWVVASLMFLLGILCCYQVLVFSLTSQIVSTAHAGIGIAVINCINMSFGHFFHTIISWVMHENDAGLVNLAGQAIYDIDAYFPALVTIPICCMIGMVGFMYIGNQIQRKK